MPAKDIFGVILRVLGVICLIKAALSAMLAISWATGPEMSGAPFMVPASQALVFFIVGLLLFFGTKRLIYLSYDKDP